MHQKKSEIQIGEESIGVSSDFTPSSSPVSSSVIHQKQLQFQSQNQSTTLIGTNYTPTTRALNLNHLRIQIPTFSSSNSNPSSSSSPTYQSFKEIQFGNEIICDNSKTLLSTPHKRPIMSQSPSRFSHSPTLSSLRHYQKTSVFDSESSQSSYLHSSSFAAAIATRTVALRLFRHFCCVRLIRLRLRFFILLSLPSLYFFASSYRKTFLHELLFVLAFSAALVISLTLALPRLPSIRLFLARSFPIKLTSLNHVSQTHPPVVWSIGSKPKSEKRPNSGSWVEVYSNGDVYEGEFHKGKCSGSGVYYYHMSGRYEGDWVDGKYDGYGVETWAKGSRYRGQYRQGLRNGIGVYRFFTGDVYAGEWSNGQCHGCGVHTCEDGSRYVGEFKWGVKHGLGHYHFRNGDTYAGEYFADKMHGFGVYRYDNGHRYEGAWHEGRRQGLGMYTFRSGEIQSGHWQSGVLNISSTPDIIIGSPLMVDHSKVLNAVQEAQRAAEKAYIVAKVDQRVNKAIAAANKAANAARVAAVKAVQNRMHHNYNNDGALDRYV